MTMFVKPEACLAPNSVAFETSPPVKPTRSREYDVRWLLGEEINLMDGPADALAPLVCVTMGSLRRAGAGGLS
jgi:hypothetical protein